MGGLGNLYTGDCSKVGNMSLWIHLAINAVSTMLLSASNCMSLAALPIYNYVLAAGVADIYRYDADP